MRARLNALPRETRDTLFLLVVIAGCLAPLAARLPAWASALALALLAWRAQLAWRARALPGRWVRALLLALAVALTWASHRTILGHEAGVTLIALLLALKTLELRARRDAMVVFFLGFFTLLTQFFFSQSLATAAAMLLALLGLLTALVNAHRPVAPAPLAESLGTALRLVLLGAPLTLALFLLFPRLAPLWGLPSDQLAGRSGLSGQMRVGSIAALALDDSIALRLRFDTPDGQAPASSQLYFRGPVLSAFDGREWLALSEPGAHAGGWMRPPPAQLRVAGAPIAYEATLEPSRRPWLLLLDATPEPPVLPQGQQARMTPELQWLASRPLTSVLRYRAQTWLDFSHGPLSRTPLLAPYVQLPAEMNPQTAALARQLRAQVGSGDGAAQALVDAALARLRNGGYRYTLEPGVYGEHTADEFWFTRKAGFCEHIASAFVVLLRAAGVPARIVTGYQGGQANPVDGYWTVRESDAHAWAEVWIAGRGWVRVDPTSAVAPDRIGLSERLQPPRSALGNAVRAVVSPTLAQHLRALWEALDNGWNQWVLSYTQERQFDLLRALGVAHPDAGTLVRALGLLASVAAALALVWALRRRQHLAPGPRLLRQVRQRLARSGLVLPEHLPPRAMAERVRAHFGPSADALTQWLLRLEQARYAAHPDTALPALRRQLRQLHWPRRPTP